MDPLTLARVCLALTLASLLCCMEFSPLETDLDTHEQDSTAKNLALLAMQPAPSSRWSFAVLADSHQAFDTLDSVVEQINAVEDLELVFHLGDLSAVGLCRDYRSTLAALRRLNVPFFTAIGNHDTLSNGKELYSGMFGPTDYAFSFGGARFVVFNSNTLEFGAHVPDREWLSRETAPSHDHALVVTLTHQPSPPIPYLDILTQNQVTAAISAHDHTFRFAAVEDVLTVKVAHAQEGFWLLVHVSDDGLSMDACSRNGCSARAP